MIEINESLLENFEINNIYKKDYIKVFTIYAQDFEYFSKTISSLTKRLNKYRIDDNNLSKFLGFYWKFIKTCNSLPLLISECATLIETNNNVNIKKIKDILCVAYPDYQKEFDYVIKKFKEFQSSRTNLFFDFNEHLISSPDNILLYEGNYKITKLHKFIKKKNYFLEPNFKKVNSISLFNPQPELLQEISYMDICHYINVFNFDWLNRNYDNLNLFISNDNLLFKL